MRKGQKRIGEILVGLGLITPEQLKEALVEQKRSKEFLGLLLIKKNFITEEGLLKALSEQFGIPIVHIIKNDIDWSLQHLFSTTLLLDYKCFPISRDNWSVTFAITNPLDIWMIKKIEEETGGLRLRLVLVSHHELNAVLQEYKIRLREHINTLLG